MLLSTVIGDPCEKVKDEVYICFSQGRRARSPRVNILTSARDTSTGKLFTKFSLDKLFSCHPTGVCVRACIAFVHVFASKYFLFTFR